MKGHRILISPSGHTCPVCHRADIRLRQSGVLFPHSPGPLATVGMYTAGEMGFKQCRGSSGKPSSDVGLSGVAEAHFAAVKKELERDAD